jgi:phage-related baseplate assembly protein
LSEISELAEVPEMSFINGLTLSETQDMVMAIYAREYKSLTDKEPTLSKADPIYLTLKSISLIVYQVMQYIDAKGKSEMLKTATGEALDNLAALFGIVRNGAEHATATVRFTLSAAQKTVVMIPEGTRVRTGAGIYFATEKYAEVPIGQTSADVTVRAEEEGTGSTDLAAGAIDTLVDPIPYVASVESIDASTGGTDPESDESLTRRIYLAPSVYSCAGPKDAYEYYAKSWRSDVADVKVISPSPCVVAVYFTLLDGKLPSETEIASMEEYLSGETIRPLTDKVECHAPDVVEYDIDLTYWIAESNSKGAGLIQESVEQAVQDYQEWQQTVGLDINPTELIYRVRAAGAKRVAVRSPVDTSISETQVPRAVKCNLTYGGIEHD